MITITNVAIAIFFMIVGWLGGRAWLSITFPEMRVALMLMFLPPIITAAVMIVILTVIGRLGVPITLWSVGAVVALNALIPGALVLLRRAATKKNK